MTPIRSEKLTMRTEPLKTRGLVLNLSKDVQQALQPLFVALVLMLLGS
jgi:hypothetical protein